MLGNKNAGKTLFMLLFISVVFSLPLLKSSSLNSVEASNILQSDLEILLKDLKRKGKLVWKLDYNFDHYKESRLGRVDPNNLQYLVLMSDKSFSIFDKHQEKKGSWVFDAAENTLKFSFEEFNGKRISGPYPEQIFICKGYSHGKLKLSWQGRHGYVDQFYVPCHKAPIQGRVELPLL